MRKRRRIVRLMGRRFKEAQDDEANLEVTLIDAVHRMRPAYHLNLAVHFYFRSKL